jgi:hypothetical protein
MLGQNGMVPDFMPNTKIVATLGPASDSPHAIRQLLLAGAELGRTASILLALAGI